MHAARRFRRLTSRALPLARHLHGHERSARSQALRCTPRVDGSLLPPRSAGATRRLWSRHSPNIIQLQVTDPCADVFVFVERNQSRRHSREADATIQCSGFVNPPFGEGLKRELAVVHKIAKETNRSWSAVLDNLINFIEDRAHFFRETRRRPRGCMIAP